MSVAFNALAALLRRHADGLILTVDTPAHIQVDRPAPPGDKPAFVASAKIGKRYVALHLMPLYVHPELVADLPDALRARMHGKSCLNFAPDKPVPEAELDTLIAAAMAAGID